MLKEVLEDKVKDVIDTGRNGRRVVWLVYDARMEEKVLDQWNIRRESPIIDTLKMEQKIRHAT